MEIKKYTSYDQIDSELEILKLEKEISHQRLVLTFQKTKEALKPKHIVNSFIGSFKSGFTGSYSQIINIVIPFVVKWYINKKRGR
ncbi:MULTISPECIES: DUF6327 family protein [unclassified Flavobacterium]|uniref:DUF6327 family protein n=1 Tax=unclassified Flavobacterium TaxID=196869 RepID=UPI001570BB64|nr:MULTISPECIES: DUF6327 family protein [unclassified Flavobacterium]MBE0392041.1 hypothetical protein [Flavobacterium sp. PL002]NRT14471.1 hypothetical protein [Flavobacterium sp. 28A]